MTTYSAILSTIENQIREGFKIEIQERLTQAIKKISKKFNLPLEDISSEFDFDDICFDITRSMKMNLDKKTKTSPEEKKKSKKKTSDEKKDKRCCPYVFPKGEKKGEVCGVNIRGGDDAEFCSKHSKTKKSGDSEEVCQNIMTKGDRKGQICGAKAKYGDRCNAHKNKENTEIKIKPLKDNPPKKTKKNSNKESSSEEETVEEKKEPMIKRKPKFTHNKELNIYVHQPTNLVIKSSDEHIIIGRLVKDNVIPLTDVDIEVCNENGFKYDSDFFLKKNSVEEELEDE